MRIKEISYERLFNLEDYNNERIRLVADIGEYEDWTKAYSELIFKVLAIHNALEIYRYSCEMVKKYLEQKMYYQKKIRQYEAEYKIAEERVLKLKALLKEGREDLIEETACATRTLNRVKSDLNSARKQFEYYSELAEKFINYKVKIYDLLKQGKFNEINKLAEEIEEFKTYRLVESYEF